MKFRTHIFVYTVKKEIMACCGIWEDEQIRAKRKDPVALNRGLAPSAKTKNPAIKTGFFG